MSDTKPINPTYPIWPARRIKRDDGDAKEGPGRTDESKLENESDSDDRPHVDEYA